MPGVLKGGSLVFSFPARASGRAVAEVLALRRLCDARTSGKIVLVLMPSIKLCRERVARMQQLIKPLHKCAVFPLARSPPSP